MLVRLAIPKVFGLMLLLTPQVGITASFVRAFHFECDVQSGRMAATLYTLLENTPLPAQDHLLSDPGESPPCRLSAAHTITLKAVDIPEHPNDDGLEVRVDGYLLEVLSVDVPLANPMDDYIASTTIRLRKDGSLGLVFKNERIFK